MNENHWVVSSFLDGVISLYNSLSSTTLSAELAEQLARIYSHLKGSVEDGGLTVHHIPVQKQKGVSDCGPFAIAFAYHAALGDDLQTITSDQDKLRTHLVTCFEKEKFSRFPLMSSKVKRACKPSGELIKLYCDCRLPGSYDDMVACNRCGKWFHYICVGFVASRAGDWYCSGCS